MATTSTSTGPSATNPQTTAERAAMLVRGVPLPDPRTVPPAHRGTIAGLTAPTFFFALQNEPQLWPIGAALLLALAPYVLGPAAYMVRLGQFAHGPMARFKLMLSTWRLRHARPLDALVWHDPAMHAALYTLILDDAAAAKAARAAHRALAAGDDTPASALITRACAAANVPVTTRPNVALESMPQQQAWRLQTVFPNGFGLLRVDVFTLISALFLVLVTALRYANHPWQRALSVLEIGLIRLGEALPVEPMVVIFALVLAGLTVRVVRIRAFSRVFSAVGLPVLRKRGRLFVTRLHVLNLVEPALRQDPALRALLTAYVLQKPAHHKHIMEAVATNQPLSALAEKAAQAVHGT